MKRTISIILAAVMLITAFTISAYADTQTVRLKVSGTTVKSLNKALFKEVNELRADMDTPKLKMDKNLVTAAYKRASMLAVMYSNADSCVESKELPGLYIIAKGDEYKALDKFERSLCDEDEELNACGIANLTVGETTYWVMCFDTLDTIAKYSSYSSKKTSYSFTANYYISSLTVKEQFGEFKNKTLRLGKTSMGRVTLTNGTKLKNSKKNFPVVYTSSDPEIASVSAYGKVTANKPSAFKPKSRYTPKKGDFILFHWYKNDGWLANHVGIVYRVKGKTVTTIEGNTGGTTYRNSKVSARKYSLKSSSIVGYIDNSMELGKKKAASLANLAKKQIGKKGVNYYAHTKAWKEFLGGKYMADNWCAIFCGWLLEQKDIDPFDLNWSPSCTSWIRQCNNAAVAVITAEIPGTDQTYSYKVSVTV